LGHFFHGNIWSPVPRDQKIVSQELGSSDDSSLAVDTLMDKFPNAFGNLSNKIGSPAFAEWLARCPSCEYPFWLKSFPDKYLSFSYGQKFIHM
jgi:hypothetical protein